MNPARFPLAALGLLALAAFPGVWSAPAPAAPLAQEPAAKEPAAEDAAKRKLEKLRRLMEAMNQRGIGKKSLELVSESFEKMGLSADFARTFSERFDIERTIEWSVEIYGRRLEESTIDAMLAFYESEEGKKLAELLPEITLEAMKKGQDYGQELATEIMQGK